MSVRAPALKNPNRDEPCANCSSAAPQRNEEIWQEQNQRRRLTVEQRAEVGQRRGKTDDHRRERRGQSAGVLAELEPPLRIDLAGVAVDRRLIRQRGL